MAAPAYPCVCVCVFVHVCWCVVARMCVESGSAGTHFVCACVYTAVFQLSEWIRLSRVDKHCSEYHTHTHSHTHTHTHTHAAWNGYRDCAKIGSVCEDSLSGGLTRPKIITSVWWDLKVMMIMSKNSDQDILLIIFTFLNNFIHLIPSHKLTHLTGGAFQWNNRRQRSEPLLSTARRLSCPLKCFWSNHIWHSIYYSISQG